PLAEIVSVTCVAWLGIGVSAFPENSPGFRTPASLRVLQHLKSRDADGNSGLCDGVLSRSKDITGCDVEYVVPAITTVGAVFLHGSSAFTRGRTISSPVVTGAVRKVSEPRTCAT